ncbi:MAG: PQQ-dependent sugar dehydrogenase, partial [Gemmataceae bacterium]
MPRRARPNPLSVLQLEDRAVPTILPTGYAEGFVTDQLVAPTVMEFAPDGRLFVAEQEGAVRILQDGELLPDPFYIVSAQTNVGERGLLGLKLHPDFQTNGYVYLYYTVDATDESPAHNRISRVVANGNVAAAGSEEILVEL